MMLSRMFCTAALSWRGSIVPVQKEKAPDERRMQQTLLNRDQVEKNLIKSKLNWKLVLKAKMTEI